MNIIQTHISIDARVYYNEAQTLLFLKRNKLLNSEFRRFLREYRINNIAKQQDLLDDEKKGL